VTKTLTEGTEKYIIIEERARPEGVQLDVEGRDAGRLAVGPKGSALPGRGAKEKDGVMRRICVTVLTVVFLLLACGCASSRRAVRAWFSPGIATPAPAAASTSAEPKDASVRPSLEQQGFAVFGFRAIRDGYGQLSIVGEIKNTGSATRGVELQASLRDTSGRLVAVGHFCPASNRNIAPGESWPFTYSFGRQEDAVDAELRIVGTFRTTDILNSPAGGSTDQ
jgi:hypothetical protein